MHTPTRRHPQPSRHTRAAALLAALLCLWMGTLGVAAHTDDLRGGPSCSPRAVLGHASATAPADTCAACQWLSSVQSSGPHVAAVTLPNRHTPWAYPRLSARAHARPRLHSAARAPPPPSLSLVPALS